MYYGYDAALERAIEKDKAIKAQFQRMLEQAQTEAEYQYIRRKMKQCPSCTISLLRVRMGMPDSVPASKVVAEYKRRKAMMTTVHRYKTQADW